MAIKKITFRGKTEEEMKTLDFEEFKRLIPAGSRRSLERGYTEVQKALIRRLEAGENNVKTHCRDVVITPLMLGKTLRIHKGNEFVPVLVQLEMLGHRLGEFALTRKGVKHSAAGIGATRSSKAVSAR